jgi:hypothetical protein
MTQVPTPLTRPAAPLNQVGYRRSLVTPDLLFIVRPNNDTIHGAGYIDPSAEPILIRVPDAGTRFWSIQWADPWTNIALGVGSRSGSKPGLYAIVGPKWKGKLPEGATEVRLGEGHHQIVLRVGYSSFENQVDTDADLQKAVETLHGFVVASLSKGQRPPVSDFWSITMYRGDMVDSEGATSPIPMGSACWRRSGSSRANRSHRTRRRGPPSIGPR